MRAVIVLAHPVTLAPVEFEITEFVDYFKKGGQPYASVRVGDKDREPGNVWLGNVRLKM